MLANSGKKFQVELSRFLVNFEILARSTTMGKLSNFDKNLNIELSRFFQVFKLTMANYQILTKNSKSSKVDFSSIFEISAMSALANFGKKFE